MTTEQELIEYCERRIQELGDDGRAGYYERMRTILKNQTPPPVQKSCRSCGQIIVRTTESDGRWIRRSFCSVVCKQRKTAPRLKKT